MLLISPLAQPHHGVVLLAVMTFLASRALHVEGDTASRATAAGVLIASFVALEWAPSGPYRGLALNAVILSMFLVVPWLVRRHPSQ